jgi:hypothetical protein
LGLKATPGVYDMWKFQRNKIKIPIVVNHPKSLCCQKMLFGALGVKRIVVPFWGLFVAVT